MKALANFCKVFTAICKANLRLHLRKCDLLQHKTTFLRHVLIMEGIATDLAKVAVVKNWPTPTNVQQLRSFLGLASYYCWFVKEFASLLHELTKKRNI